MIGLGRIIARMGRTYGWTPRQILSELSLEQMATLHRYAREMDGLIPRTDDGRPDADAIWQEFAGMIRRHEGDGPDVDAIEARYGDRIKRQTAETADVATIERITGLKVQRGKA